MARTRNLSIVVDGDLVVERDPDRPSGRLLRQADMDASYVDLADPQHLEFDYPRMIRLVLRTCGAGKRVVHVGGAACTLARALLAEDPASRHEVIEIDPLALEVARGHLGLRRQPGLKLRVGDGRAAVAARADASADAIVVDAFIGARVPHHLLSAEACREYSRVAPLTVANVVDSGGWPQARAVAAALSESYPHVGALSGRARRNGNVVLFGASAQPDYRRLEQRAAADVHPARLIRAADLGGSGAWRDHEAAQDPDAK